MSDGTLIFDTKIDRSGFEKGADGIESLAKRVVGTVAKTFAVGSLAKGLLNVGKTALTAASGLEEVQNVVDVTFGEGAAQVDSWAKRAADAYGMSEKAAKQYVGTMGAMLKSSGVAGDAALDMSTKVTGLAADFASFYNLSHEEAFTKIRAGISGEMEPLKQLGINMSVANLEAYALAQGIEKSYEKMSQAEQVMLRYNYLMSVSADAQGDFARTADNYANVMRNIETNAERISAGIGQRLIPTATKAAVELRDMSGSLADSIDVGGLQGGISYIQTEFPVATSAASALAAAIATMRVLTPVTKLVKSYTAANSTLAKKLAAGTAAELASAGALKAKEIIVGVATKKITLLTGAQAAYNAVLSANPIMLVAGAIGALVGTVILAERAMVKANPEMRAMEENAISLRQANEDLANSIEASADSYNRTMSGLTGNAQAADGLIMKLEELSQSYTGTNMEQQQMQSICDALNSKVENLNVSFDKQTGALNMSAAAMKELAKASADAAIQQAAVERLTELYMEQAEAQYARAKAEEEYFKVMQNTSDYTLKTQRNVIKAYKEAKEASDSVNESVEYQEGYVKSLGVEYEKTAGNVSEFSNAEAAAADAAERIIVGGYDVTEVLNSTGMTAEEAADRLNEYTAAAQNMFEVISTESEISVADMINNLNANAAAVRQYGQDLAAIAGQIPADLYTSLAGNPEQFAGVVSALASASPEDLEMLSASWAGAGEAAKQAMLESLGAVVEGEETPITKMTQAVEGDVGLETAVQEKITAAIAAMNTAVATGGAETAGAEMINGLIRGMNNRTGPLYATARRIVQQTISEMRSEAEIASPSKITTTYGEFLMDGWIVGIKRRIGLAKETARSAVSSVLSEFAGDTMPGATRQLREAEGAAGVYNGGNTYNTTQNIYAQKQSPAEMLREAQWLAKRAVTIGV